MKNIVLIGIGEIGLSHLAIANNIQGIKVVVVCDITRYLYNKY